MSSVVSQILIFFLLNTDFVPTKKFPVAGLVPHTIAGAPSNFTDRTKAFKKASKTERVPKDAVFRVFNVDVFHTLIIRGKPRPLQAGLGQFIRWSPCVVSSHGYDRMTRVIRSEDHGVHHAVDPIKEDVSCILPLFVTIPFFVWHEMG